MKVLAATMLLAALAGTALGAAWRGSTYGTYGTVYSAQVCAAAAACGPREYCCGTGSTRYCTTQRKMGQDCDGPA
ncbi:hypothetical protein JDV02_010356 [Purpureocillium takamizusanense]|uniref:Uncharacterized protein n=1 Tax=Purpureocillium takamizusanense TaxID=2060973 RepID=A0A9Q8QS25_9HYPO|nr:uncharacterized protein JDV02_010356 [Purpureocillium takamizusanense]UNI24623.1 hypothetical protein JDV02_010356 [Purpureocillium takamizusanense]